MYNLNMIVAYDVKQPISISVKQRRHGFNVPLHIPAREAYWKVASHTRKNIHNMSIMSCHIKRISAIASMTDASSTET